MHDFSQYTFFHEGFESPSEVKSEISELKEWKELSSDKHCRKMPQGLLWRT